MAGSSFTWDASKLRVNIDQLPNLLNRLVVASTMLIGTRGEAYMKSNAPWHDRTANARNSLNTKVENGAREHSITYAHGMPYGIWLEIRFAGRNQIIMPSVTKGGADLMKLLENGMGRL